MCHVWRLCSMQQNVQMKLFYGSSVHWKFYEPNRMIFLHVWPKYGFSSCIFSPQTIHLNRLTLSLNLRSHFKTRLVYPKKCIVFFLNIAFWRGYFRRADTNAMFLLFTIMQKISIFSYRCLFSADCSPFLVWKPCEKGI